MNDAEIRDWLEEVADVPDSWSIAGGQVTIPLGSSGIPIVLMPRHLMELKRNNFPTIKGLKRVSNCGIEFGGYAEYLLNLEGWGPWPLDKPLRFKVGDTRVTVGQISPALAIILEAAYRSRDYMQTEFFESYCSMQVEGSPKPREDASVAVFYLNADYLRPLQTAARIHHLIDPAGPDPSPVLGDPKEIIRQRVRTRKRIYTLPAVALYNEACTEWGEARFLGFYRVLEYFFRRGALSDFGSMRRDASISDAELLLRSRFEKELPQLKALLRSVLTRSEQRKIVAFAKRHNLANAAGIDDLGFALYEHRNMVVHAKETEIERTHIPAHFEPESSQSRWGWIAETVAERAIRRL